MSLPEEVKRHMEEMARRYAESDFHESGPHIGIFYLVDGRVFLQSVTTGSQKSTGMTVSYGNNHRKYWFEIIKYHRPDLKDVHFAYYPRGRVGYFEGTNKYIMMVDRCIPEELRQEIRSDLGLDSRNSDTFEGGHYECAKCNPLGYKDLHKL